MPTLWTIVQIQLDSSSDQYGEIRRGLHAHDNSSTSELLVIRACIQLLTSGSKIFTTLGKPFIHSADKVAVQLKLQRYAGRVKESNAVKLLKFGLTQETDAGNFVANECQS